MSRKFLENLRKIEKALDMKSRVPQLKELDEYLQAETVTQILLNLGVQIEAG